MNGERHAAISQMLLDTAESLAINPRTTLAAGELIWGATFHACSAADHHTDQPHRQPQTRRELALVITGLTIDPPTRRNFLRTLHEAVRRLHDNFYSGELTYVQLVDDIAMGTSFVRQLLQIAARR